MVAGTEREPLLSQPSTQSGHVNETGKGRSKSIRDGLDDTESQSRVQVTVVEDIEGYGTVEDGGRRGGSDSPKDLRIARIVSMDCIDVSAVLTSVIFVRIPGFFIHGTDWTQNNPYM